MNQSAFPTKKSVNNQLFAEIMCQNKKPSKSNTAPCSKTEEMQDIFISREGVLRLCPVTPVYIYLLPKASSSDQSDQLIFCKVIYDTQLERGSVFN